MILIWLLILSRARTINQDNIIATDRIALKLLLKDRESPKRPRDPLALCDRGVVLSEMVGATMA